MSGVVPAETFFIVGRFNMPPSDAPQLTQWLSKFFGHTSVSDVEALTVVAIRVAIVLVIALLTSRMLLRFIDRRLKLDHEIDGPSLRAYKKFSRWFLWTLSALIAVHVAGIDLSSVFTTGGLFAVALGFALKGIAENYFAGMTLRTEESIKHGDVLEVGGEMVKVKTIGLRDTIVRARDDKDILVPNSLLIQNKVGNYTLADSICRVARRSESATPRT
jgi:potassium efflux system protein